MKVILGVLVIKLLILTYNKTVYILWLKEDLKDLWVFPVMLLMYNIKIELDNKICKTGLTMKEFIIGYLKWFILIVLIKMLFLLKTNQIFS